MYECEESSCWDVGIYEEVSYSTVATSFQEALSCSGSYVSGKRSAIKGLGESDDDCYDCRGASYLVDAADK